MAKTIRCKRCGTEFPKYMKRCPNCNKKVSHPIRTLLSILLTLVFLFIAFAVFIGLETNDKSTSGGGSDTGMVLVDDDYIKAEFVKFEEATSLGVHYTVIRVTNKTDREIWVHLDDASLNDEMVQTFAGMPLYILPEKKGSCAFFHYLSETSIESFDDIKTVSFKIVVRDEETLDIIETTQEFTINK